MATEQPLGTDYLNNPSHSKMHRVYAIDSAAPDESVVVDSAGNVTIAENASAKMMKQVNTWHAFGGFQNSATTITCTQNIWSKITNGTSNLWIVPEAVGISVSGDNFTIANAGDYYGHFTLAVSQANNNDFFIRCVNITTGIQQSYIIGATTLGASNYVNISLPLYLENVAANDVFQFQIMNISNNDDPVVRSAVFFIAYLHN